MSYGSMFIADADRLLDVLPCDAKRDIGGVASGYGVFLGQLPVSHSGCMVGPQGPNEFIGELGALVGLAPFKAFGMQSRGMLVPSLEEVRVFPSPLGITLGLTPLPELVVTVILAGSEKQMRRIAARRVVALMACEETTRLYSSREEKGYSVRPMHEAVRGKKAVASVVSESDPYPAFARLIDGRPETGLVFIVELKNGRGSHIAKSLSYLVSVCRLLITAANATYFPRRATQGKRK